MSMKYTQSRTGSEEWVLHEIDFAFSILKTLENRLSIQVCTGGALGFPD